MLQHVQYDAIQSLQLMEGLQVDRDSLL